MGILIEAPSRRHDGPGMPANSPAVVPGNEPAGALHIREVVRITGLRREQLYMWQRRYGFPAPLRDAFGDRVYPADQVARLKLIKQLLSEGRRAGAVVPLAVEIWPTSIVVERGERLVLEVGAKDDPRSFFQHDDPRDRARTGTNTIHTGGKFDSHLLLPIIPAR